MPPFRRLIREATHFLGAQEDAQRDRSYDSNMRQGLEGGGNHGFC
jgi:hypothetical protein